MSDVRFEVSGGIGRITLNRPAGDQRADHRHAGRHRRPARRLADDDRRGAGAPGGAGERGLCSGADVRALRAELTERGEVAAEVFFAVEYAVDALIATYPKHVRADMFGITMGGGLGLSAHCSERVVRADSRLAMPETIIGLFPDVGRALRTVPSPGRTGHPPGLDRRQRRRGGCGAVGLADRTEGGHRPG